MNITLITALVTLGATFCLAITFHDHCLENVTALPSDEGKLTKSQKCYIACIFNCTGFVSENGELEKEDTLVPAISYFGKAKANELSRTLEQCLSRVVKLKGDRCEVGYETALCWTNPMKAYMNITMRDMHAEPIFNAAVGNQTGIYHLLMFHLFSKNICIK